MTRTHGCAIVIDAEAGRQVSGHGAGSAPLSATWRVGLAGLDRATAIARHAGRVGSSGLVRPSGRRPPPSGSRSDKPPDSPRTISIPTTGPGVGGLRWMSANHWADITDCGRVGGQEPEPAV